MKVKSFEDLECLLPEDVRKDLHKERERRSKEREYRQQVAYEKYDGRPKSRYTERRVLPILPKWIKGKLLEVREMDSYDCFGVDEDYEASNHTMTLPLDDKNVVTFGIRDCLYLKTLHHDMPVIIEVYKDLQKFCRKYGHELTLVYISGRFGNLWLPESFYDMNDEEETDEYISGCNDSLIKNFLERFIDPDDVSLEKMEKQAIKYGEELTESERKKFHTWFAYEQMQRTEYCDAMKTILEASGHRYEMWVGWKYVVMSFVKDYSGRSIRYVKWRIGDNLDHLIRFEAVRPLLDKILKKTSECCFSFGIKPREKCILSSPVASV